MEYVVLARKLRPQRFQDLIGQDTAAKALRNAVVSGRVAHAFLFAGSRGVGKTSAARILTKALNCLNPAEGEPCNECEHCREITANASPDVQEIDGASNRGIDSIRELRENTRYAPAKCRFKTYIIDEVHMLTNESFNALLKTLEEPPPHIKFILATTAPQRLPETIISRCQRYDFARIPIRVMVDYLAGVAAAEGLTLSPEALEAIARGSAGGMRDALTALDQVVSFAGSAPSEEQVLGMLGLMDNRQVLELLDAVLAKELPAAMAAFEALVERGADLHTLLAALLREIKDLTLFQVLAEPGGYFQDHAPAALEFFGAHQGLCGTEELQQVFHLLLELEGQLRVSEFGRACFEMALVKACRVTPLVGIPELLEKARGFAGSNFAGSNPAGSPPAGRPSPTAAPAAPSPPPAEPRPRPGGQPRARETGAAGGGGGGAPGVPSDEPDPERAPTDPPPEAGPATEPPPALSRPPPAPPQPAAAGAPAPEGTPAAASPGAEREPLPPLETPLPCEDARWVDFIERVKPDKPKLAADLRRAEVVAITDTEVEVLPPPGAELFDGPEPEILFSALREAFGEAFLPRPRHDKNRRARTAFSLVGRERQREEARLAAERGAAASDPAVTDVLRYFPEGRVRDVQPPNPNGSKDV